MRTLVDSILTQAGRISMGAGILILLHGCSDANLQGESSSSGSKKNGGDSAPQKMAGDSPNSNATSHNVDTYLELENDARKSELPVERICSNRFTEAVQTNFFLADKGVELVFVNSSNVKKVVPAGDLSATLLSDVLADGKLKVDFKALGVEDGEYAIGLCDVSFPTCKEKFVYADAAYLGEKSNISGNNRPSGLDSKLRQQFKIIHKGLFGIVSGLKIENGMGKAAGAVVLLNANITLAKKFLDGNVFGQGDARSKRKQRLANNFNKDDYFKDLKLSTDPRADDVEACDRSVSPLVLDFGNDGVFGGEGEIQTFDINADGRLDRLSNTLDSNDYLLAMDRNHNGKVDNATELFGNYTGSLNSKASYANGFDALATLDNNRDGVIDARDTSFKQIKLWQMGGHKMLPLSSKGVVAISLAYKRTAKVDVASGNMVLQSGRFTMSDGKELPVVDLWYRVGSDNIARRP